MYIALSNVSTKMELLIMFHLGKWGEEYPLTKLMNIKEFILIINQNLSEYVYNCLPSLLAIAFSSGSSWFSNVLQNPIYMSGTFFPKLSNIQSTNNLIPSPLFCWVSSISCFWSNVMVHFILINTSKGYHSTLFQCATYECTSNDKLLV